MKRFHLLAFAMLLFTIRSVYAESPSIQVTLDWINSNLRDTNPGLVEGSTDIGSVSTLEGSRDFQVGFNASGNLQITSSWKHFIFSGSGDRITDGVENRPLTDWRSFDPDQVVVMRVSETTRMKSLGGDRNALVLAVKHNGKNHFLFPLPGDSSMHPRFASAFRALLQQAKKLPKEPF